MKYLKKYTRIYENEKVESDNIYYFDIDIKEIETYLYSLTDISSWKRISRGFLTNGYASSNFEYEKDVDLENISITENQFAKQAIKVDMKLKGDGGDKIYHDGDVYSNIKDIEFISICLEEIKSRLGNESGLVYNFSDNFISLIIYKKV